MLPLDHGGPVSEYKMDRLSERHWSGQCFSKSKHWYIKAISYLDAVVALERLSLNAKLSPLLHNVCRRFFLPPKNISETNLTR